MKPTCNIFTILVSKLIIIYHFVAPPVIVRPPESNALEEQRPFSLACVSTGIPDPTVTFYHNSIEVKQSNRISQNGHFLVITDAGKSDSGEYYCIAENIAGVVQSEPARIVVFSKLHSVIL